MDNETGHRILAEWRYEPREFQLTRRDGSNILDEPVCIIIRKYVKACKQTHEPVACAYFTVEFLLVELDFETQSPSNLALSREAMGATFTDRETAVEFASGLLREWYGNFTDPFGIFRGALVGYCDRCADEKIEEKLKRSPAIMGSDQYQAYLRYAEQAYSYRLRRVNSSYGTARCPKCADQRRLASLKGYRREMNSIYGEHLTPGTLVEDKFEKWDAEDKVYARLKWWNVIAMSSAIFSLVCTYIRIFWS